MTSAFGFPFCTRIFLIVFIVLTLAYVPLLLNPLLYCLALVPFQMYLAMTLPSRLMSVLLETIKSQCHVIIPQFKY